MFKQTHAATTLTNLNFSQSTFNCMVGRKSELNQIQQALKNNHRVSIGGLPGVGKSYLAMFYAVTYQNEYDIVWVIDCKKNIYKEYKNFAQAINSTFDRKFVDIGSSNINLINSLKEFLRKTQYTCLIIYDNYMFQEEYEKYFPMHADKKNYFLLKSWELSDMNLQEMPFTDRVNLFRSISNNDDIKQIEYIIKTCRLDNTLELIEAAKKKQRGHPVVSINKNDKRCILPAYNKNNSMYEIILWLKNNFFSSYQLIQYISMFGTVPVEINFIKEIYLLNTSYKEQDFYNDVDTLISKHLLYYKNNNQIMLPGVIHKILLNKVITNQDQIVFKELFKGIMRYIKNNVLLEHKLNIKNLIYNHIRKIIEVGSAINCNKEVLDLYFILLDYHVRFDRDLKEINNLLKKIGDVFKDKNIFIQTKIKYLSKLSNYYFMLGQLEDSLKIEKHLSKLLYINKYVSDKKENEHNTIFNKIMLLKIYSNMGNLEKCESIKIPKLEGVGLEAELLYLKSHYMEAKSYIKYLKSDLNGALNDINDALDLAFCLAKKFNAETNIHYTCAHLFSKKYLYMFEMGMDTRDINEIHHKIYTQAINKNDKSIAAIKMIYGYIQGSTEDLKSGIENIKVSINIYNNLYKSQSNKNLSAAYKLLGDLYFKDHKFHKAEKYYTNAINILKKCYINYKTHDYEALLEKLIVVAKINSNYILLKHYYKHYVSLYGGNNYFVDDVLYSIEF